MVGEQFRGAEMRPAGAELERYLLRLMVGYNVVGCPV